MYNKIVGFVKIYEVMIEFCYFNWNYGVYVKYSLEYRWIYVVLLFRLIVKFLFLGWYDNRIKEYWNFYVLELLSIDFLVIFFGGIIED